MKSEKGITLTALAIYVSVFFIILTTMSIITSHFFSNIDELKNSPKYVVEFNKFSMFFVADMKRNSEIVSVTSTDLEFADGTKYSYKDNAIYRNEEKIAKSVKDFAFSTYEHTQNEFTKTIVNVNMTIGNQKESANKNIDFVLKYW